MAHSKAARSGYSRINRPDSSSTASIRSITPPGRPAARRRRGNATSVLAAIAALISSDLLGK